MTARPKLILLNGPPAVGKTSLARRYADEHPLTLHLDVDEIRSMISSWSSDAAGSGLRARSMVEAMAESYLSNGHDVVISQLYGRAEGLAQLEEVARAGDATWIEFALTAPVRVIEDRFIERGGPQLNAITSSERSVAERLAEFQDRIAIVIAERPTCAVIDTAGGDFDKIYREILTAIAAATTI